MSEKKNPLVFMDVSIEKAHVGKMIFELFKEEAPHTVENFRALCTGEKGIGPQTHLPLHYKGSYFYMVQKGYSYVKGGDFYNCIGTCGESIYGDDFPDERNDLKHNEPGLLSMNIGDRYAIGSHFVITLRPDENLDRFHVVFGKVVDGFETLVKMMNAYPCGPIQVMDCGEYNEDETRAVIEAKKKGKNIMDCGEYNEDETRAGIEEKEKEKKAMDETKYPVFMDVHMSPYIGRMVFELFYDSVPFTAENFRALCTGEKGFSPKTLQKLWYTNSFFHHVKEGGSYVKGGAICYDPGTSVESIYGRHFPIESNGIKHDREGLLTMARKDMLASRSYFGITLRAEPRLDSSHVVFGKLVRGLETLQDIGYFGWRSMYVSIATCGVLHDDDIMPENTFVRPCPGKPVLSRRIISVSEESSSSPNEAQPQEKDELCD